MVAMFFGTRHQQGFDPTELEDREKLKFMEKEKSSISIRAISMMIMTIKTSDKDKIKTVYLILEGIFC